MKINFILLAGFLFCASLAFGACSNTDYGQGVTCIYANQAMGSSPNMTTQTVNVSTNFPTGTHILASAYYCYSSDCATGSGSTTLAISDNINNPETCFTASDGVVTTALPNTEHVYWFDCPSMPAGVTSFTVTCSTASACSFLSLSVEGFSGMCSVAPCIDQVGYAADSGQGTTATVSTASSTVCTNELVVGFMQNNNDESMTVGSGYTEIQRTSNANLAEGKTVATAGVQTATSTWTGNDYWQAQVIAVKSASSTCTTSGQSLWLGR